MTTVLKARSCAGPHEFPAISEFLFALYQPDNRDGNWLQPIFEYAYTHPWFDSTAIGRIGIWEDGARIVAVALYELRLGEAFFQVAPGYGHLKQDMLQYAESRLAVSDSEGRMDLRVYVNDFDANFLDLVAARGYVREPDADRPMAQYRIPRPFPAVPVPAGYRVMSVAENNDLARIDRVLWRGFNHPGEPPADGAADRALMQSGPHYRKDLNIVAVAPDDSFAAFAGMWLDAANALCYVEPVATDPEHRRRGVGRAAVMEGIKRCAAHGASVAYVGSAQPFYLSMGFKLLHSQQCWRAGIGR